MASSTIVNVIIQSDSNESSIEERFDSTLKVSELKKKLELITSATQTGMKVTLFVDDNEVGLLSNDDETLAHYLGDQLNEESSVKLFVKDEKPSSIRRLASKHIVIQSPTDNIFSPISRKLLGRKRLDPTKVLPEL